MGAGWWTKATPFLSCRPLRLLCLTPHVCRISQLLLDLPLLLILGEWGPVQTIHSCTLSEDKGVSISQSETLTTANIVRHFTEPGIILSLVLILTLFIFIRGHR